MQVDPAVPMETFRASVYKVLSDGGLSGVCPLGLQDGNWATTGGMVRACVFACFLYVYSVHASLTARTTLVDERR